MFQISKFYRAHRVPLHRVYSWKRPAAEIPKNLIADQVKTELELPNGPIIYNKPYVTMLKNDKKYSWCACGHSNTQPFCDGTHKYAPYQIKERPVKFKVEKHRTYTICMCRQTKHRPFCDGTHLEKHIKDKMLPQNKNAYHCAILVREAMKNDSNKND